MRKLKLEFGDALRRLRDGEGIVMKTPHRFRTLVLWDARALWAYSQGGWLPIKAPLNLIMTAEWFLDTDPAPMPPLPLGPAPEAIELKDLP